MADIPLQEDASKTVSALPPEGQMKLLRQQRFAPFFWTQFLGALNDNVFKIAFTSLVTYQTALFSGVDGGTAAFLISAIFIVPFVLFSATSGQLADKYEKSRLIRLIKSLEIAIMLLGMAGFLLHHAVLLYSVTFLMGLHSTLFGPVKYAYLPQHLQRHELVGGNGLVEMGTFVAILLGTLLGGELAGLSASHVELGLWSVSLVCLLLALAGRLVAQRVPDSPPSQAALKINWNPLTETWRNLKLARERRTVFLSLLGISWLWFFGATFLTSFFNFTRDVLHADQNVVTLLLAIFSLGIGLGSMLCERMSGRRVELGLVPFGSIGMTMFAIDLYFASRGSVQMEPQALIGMMAFLQQPAHWRVMGDLFLLSLFGGFYSVPLYAWIQARCEPTHRARIIAANNILNAFFMIASALLAMALTKAGGTIPELFLLTGLLNAVVAVYIYSLMPEFLLRFVAWLLVHTVYRIRILGVGHLPEKGAAILVCNHVSYVDAIVLMAASPRPIRFMMDHRIFRLPLLSWFFRQAKAIPVASAQDNPAILAAAYTRCAEALAAGELVCIFPEGQITRSGELNGFRAGVGHIVQRTPVPVIPMALRGLWGSMFSRKHAAWVRPLRPGLLSRLELVIGAPIPPQQVTPEELQQAVSHLRGTWR